MHTLRSFASLSSALALVLALSACERQPQPSAAPEASAPADAPGAPHSGAALRDDQPAQAIPPATAPGVGSDAGAAADGAIGFQGFGPAAFGSDAEQVRMAWGRDLDDAQPSEPGGCHYLIPQPLGAEGYRIAFMIEGDRFVRIDVRNDSDVAPGGGRVGMDRAEIERLYADRVEASPHKYVEGAHYLRVADGDAALVFETGDDGRVTAWRIGLPPQVDYVEGCS